MDVGEEGDEDEGVGEATAFGCGSVITGAAGVGDVLSPVGIGRPVSAAIAEYGEAAGGAPSFGSSCSTKMYSL